jgi:hypothetical protein
MMNGANTIDEADRQVDLAADQQQHLADRDDRDRRRVSGQQVDDVGSGSTKVDDLVGRSRQQQRHRDTKMVASRCRPKMPSGPWSSMPSGSPCRPGTRRRADERSRACSVGLAHVRLAFASRPRSTCRRRDPRAANGCPAGTSRLRGFHPRLVLYQVLVVPSGLMIAPDRRGISYFSRSSSPGTGWAGVVRVDRVALGDEGQAGVGVRRAIGRRRCCTGTGTASAGTPAGTGPGRW